MVFPGKAFNEIEIGDTFGGSMTVTETHIVLAAGMFGDFNPLHINQQFSEQTRFGGRILHGVFTSALIGAYMGPYYAGTALGYLEQGCHFKAPVQAGDTITTTWTINEKIDKPAQNGGITVMTAVAYNQNGVLVAEANGKMLVANRN